MRSKVLVVVVALAVAACGGPAGNDSGLKGANQTLGQADVNPRDPAEVADGGNFTWPIDNMADTWNYWHLNGTPADGSRILRTFMPNLVVQNADATISLNKDYLESAELTSSEPQVIELKINPKARWSDGRQIDWTDFESMWKALNATNKAYQTNTKTGYEDISKVERGATDQDVKVTFRKRFAEWRSLFSPLFPKSVFDSPEEFNTGWVDAPKITAGPFKLGSIDRTAKIVTVVRDPAWWGERPKLDSITFRQVDRAAQADAFANGQIDWYDIGASVDSYRKAKSTPGAVIRQAVSPDYMHVTFNGAESSILKDPKLRVALMRGIDTKAITRAVIGQMLKSDAQVIGNRFFMLGSKQYQDNSAVAAFDREAARGKLEELGWKLDGEFRKKDGRELAVRLVIPLPNAVSTDIAKLIQSQLREIGVKIDIQHVPLADFFEDFVNVGNFDAAIFRWLSTATPVSSAAGIYTLTEGAVGQNYGRVGSAEINDLLQRANSELDDTRRFALANEADKKVWELGSQLPLYQLPGAVAVRDTVANFGAPAYANNPFDYIHMGFVKK
ncbi:ABC transporter family substrate-binding protein [Lentzea alba]|uniref:ABC transporter family substrate-binding protein n=1 Tax=Lentzea alba TaxID=2714351 RepID=UPI0039BFF45A